MEKTAEISRFDDLPNMRTGRFFQQPLKVTGCRLSRCCWIDQFRDGTSGLHLHGLQLQGAKMSSLQNSHVIIELRLRKILLQQ